MRQRQQQQQLDRTDPTVAQFVKECGLAENAVSIKLRGASEADLKLQIERLEKAYGPLIQMASPYVGRYNEWIVMGTILG